MTSDLVALTLHEPYTAFDSVIIGHGSGLSIANIDSFSIHLYCFRMCYMHMPCLKTLFQSRPFVPITLLMSCSLTLSFKCKIVTLSSAQALSSSVQSSLSAISMWHSLLGHPSLPIFHKFLSVLSISFPKEHLCSFSYNSCNIHKSYKLPFSTPSITSSSPLEIIFSNVWTFLVASFDGFRYYVIFVDHYTKYTWLDPLRRKSDVHSTFVAFKNLIENYFTTTIPTL